MNVYAPSEEKSDYSKDSFYEELEQVYGNFPKYHKKIPLREINAKVRKENIFITTIWNESIHQDNNVNGVRIVNFSTPNIWLLKARRSCAETFIGTTRSLLIGNLTTRLIMY